MRLLSAKYCQSRTAKSVVRPLTADTLGVSYSHFAAMVTIVVGFSDRYEHSRKVL